MQDIAHELMDFDIGIGMFVKVLHGRIFGSIAVTI